MIPTSPLQIGRASIASARRIANMQAAAFPEPWGERFVTSLMHLPGTIGFIAEAEGAPLGFVMARAIAGEAEIISIAVMETVRGHGVGAALLDHAIEAARAVGASDMHLEVGIDNHAAQALYARAGFVKTGLRRRYYADGTDALVMRRRLGVT